MKVDFPNTVKAISGAALVPTDEGEGEAKTETSPDANEPKPNPPVLDLHSPPPSIPASHRFIFREWPRDPNGKPMPPSGLSNIRGKEAGNGLGLWGATLYDFYFVNHIPGDVCARSISTGSKLSNVMNALGELEHAKIEIAWAAREASPMEMQAWDPAKAIVAYEHRVHASSAMGIRMSMVPEVSATKHEKNVQMPDPSEPVKDAVEVAGDLATEDRTDEPNGKPAESEDEVGTQQLPPKVPVESPFHPSHYPFPWPLIPLESPRPFRLQRRIPIHLLPKKLYVHDPWGLVNIDYGAGGGSWMSKTDHIRTYTLSLPPASQKMAEDASRAAAAAEDEALKNPETILISPRETEGPTKRPAVRVFLPERPRKRTEVPEAHLYLSPKGKLGTGNHSIVYEADLELPRDLFCESTYCKECLDEQVAAEVDRLKESGEWQRVLDDAAKAYVSTKEHDAAFSSSSDQIPPHHVGSDKVRLEDVPMETVDTVAATGEAPAEDAPSQQSARASDSTTNHHDGPVIPIHPNIKWQNLSFPDSLCTHEASEKKRVPRTAMFRVASKLSFRYDTHLEQEVSNYLRFPAHFFQHWSGYNLLPPLRDPTPVRALVPQFYGYYKPDSKYDSDGEYCSPILLIEHCGRPIHASKLTVDERHECFALLLRFHSAGWLHESFAERNVLVADHHPTCSPLEGDVGDRTGSSFRLIDFGRSVRCVDEVRLEDEKDEGIKLLDVL